MVQTGVLGLVAFAALVVAVGRCATRAARTSRVTTALAAGLAGVLVAMASSPTGAPDRAAAEPLRRRPVLAGVLATVALLAGLWTSGELVADRRFAAALDRPDDATAWEALRDAAATAPARFDLPLAAARLAVFSGDEDQLTASLDDLDAALRIAPDDPELLTDRAAVLAALGRDDEARAGFQAVLDRPYPESTRAREGIDALDARAP